MKVIITGITGFVGSQLMDYLLENHPEVQIFGLKRWRSPMENISHAAEKVTLYDCDLRDLSSLLYMFGEVKPDAIFHLAAQSYVPTSFVAPVDTLSTNILGTANLLEAVRLSKIDPVVHICSSSEVYGQVKKEELPITENTPFRPASPYAVSKVGEDMLGWQYFTSWGIKTLRTRMFTHTGPRRGEVFVASNFARQLVRIEMGLQKPVISVGNLDSVRTFADVRDTVRAYWVMVQKFYEGKVQAGDVFNIGGNITLTVREMLDVLVRLSGLEGKVSIEVDPSRLRPSDVTLQIPSIAKFQSCTGWQPEIPFEKTMQDLLDYWREYLAVRSKVRL